jgi:diguanylate cyclase (GGDEF)-like protein
MNNKAVILIVDSVVSNTQSLSSFLKDDYTLKIALDASSALELAQSLPIPDLILLDVHMPDMDGYEILRRLKHDEKTQSIPVIFATLNDSAEDEEKGLLLGAVDYITKPMRSAIVKARVKTHLILKAQKDELVYIALHDQLTGLFNRYYLDDEGIRKLSRAKRTQDKLSVVMVDIDYFKAVNDTHGHLVGDNIIKAVSNVLRQNKRTEDFSVRYGGEEFLILYDGCSGVNAQLKAENLRKTIESLNQDDVKVTASFGVAELSENHETLDALIKDSDEALYRAKKSGRNRVVLMDEAL